MATEGTESDPPPTSREEALAEVGAVVERARRGDPAAVPRLRELLDRYPVLWTTHGNLAAQVQGAWIKLAAGEDLHMREAVPRYAARLRADLTRPGASAVERLLAEQVVAMWLQQHYFTAAEANAVDANASPKVLQWRARRQAQAQRQYERAFAGLVAYQKTHPIAEVPVPVPLTAPVGETADQSRSLASPSTVAQDENEPSSFESIPDGQSLERVRVGLSD